MPLPPFPPQEAAALGRPLFALFSHPAPRVAHAAALIMRAVAEGGAEAAQPMREAALTGARACMLALPGPVLHPIALACMLIAGRLPGCATAAAAAAAAAAIVAAVAACVTVRLKRHEHAGHIRPCVSMSPAGLHTQKPAQLRCLPHKRARLLCPFPCAGRHTCRAAAVQ